MFLKSLGSLHIFANLGNILLVGNSRKGVVPVFLKFCIDVSKILDSGDKSCVTFFIQDRLFVIRCSAWPLCSRLLGCACMSMLLLEVVVF